MTESAFKVLVADDDASVRESLRKLLLDEGYQVFCVTNGAEAVEAFRREQEEIDLLLVDLNMPLKNGWAALDRLLEVNPSLPVLVITGQPNQCELAEAARVTALVEKPIDVQAMLELIHSILADPAGLRPQHAGRPEVPFHHVRATGYNSRYLRNEQNITPYTSGGINE